MTTPIKSPFTMNRFEHDNIHLYYLDDSTIEKLESLKSTYIVGSRGTGKTTMLTALSCEERIENSSLNKLLKEKPFETKLVGVYIKLPEYQLQKIDGWLRPLRNIEDYAAIFSFYLDLISLELLCRATAQLLSTGIIDATPEIESAFVNKFRKSEFSSFDKYFPTQAHHSLLDLSRAFQQVRSNIDVLASRECDPLSVIESHTIVQIGKLGRFFGASLIKDVYPQPLNSSEPGWHCKYCYDESECLSDTQQIVLNTMIRLSTFPVFYVASFVRQPEDSFSTTIPNLSLAKADCQFIFIDKEMDDDATFRRFVEGVSMVRIRYVLNNNDADFDITKLLGKLSINKLLQEFLSTSVSVDVKTLLEDSRQNAANEFFKDQFRDDTDNILPIYQTYLIKKLSLKLPDTTQEGWARRKDDSESFRKKMVAAYLSICNEFNADVRYSSADMVLQMSDTCIRDYLSQMDTIFREANIALDQFLSKQVSSDIQDKSLKRASKEKLDSMPKSGARHHRECARLVEAIGKLTKQLQSRHPENKHLMRTELGRFEIVLPIEHGYNWDKVTKILFESIEYGYLRVVDEGSHRITFRLHTSLSPNFRTSYRGAYYGCQIDSSMLSFFENTDDNDLRDNKIAALVSAIYNDDTIDSIPLSLFDSI